MSGNWKIPVAPTITQDYCDALLNENHDKPHAFPTTFRYSGALDCSRKLSYDAAGVERTDPMDGPSLAITSMGSLLHEAVQEAYMAKYPTACCEVPSHYGDLISGSADVVHEDTVYEIKTVGAFKFDQAVGIKRMGKDRGRTNPKGPSLSHVCQAGLNAYSLGCELVRIVYISREAVSVALAEKAGFSSLERFTAEWEVPRSVWGPLVGNEVVRLERIAAAVRGGRVTPRIWPDEGNEKLIEPENTIFPCGYCAYQHQCRMDGPGVLPIPEVKVS